MNIINLCKANNSIKALELVENPDECNLDQVNSDGNTALIFACAGKMTEVAFELLKHPDKCKLDQFNGHGNTALIFACEKK
jgi:ankyrin repeat protein